MAQQYRLVGMRQLKKSVAGHCPGQCGKALAVVNHGRMPLRPRGRLGRPGQVALIDQREPNQFPAFPGEPVQDRPRQIGHPGFGKEGEAERRNLRGEPVGAVVAVLPDIMMLCGQHGQDTMGGAARDLQSVGDPEQAEAFCMERQQIHQIWKCVSPQRGQTGADMAAGQIGLLASFMHAPPETVQ